MSPGPLRSFSQPSRLAAGKLLGSHLLFLHSPGENMILILIPTPPKMSYLHVRCASFLLNAKLAGGLKQLMQPQSKLITRCRASPPRATLSRGFACLQPSHPRFLWLHSLVPHQLWWLLKRETSTVEKVVAAEGKQTGFSGRWQGAVKPDCLCWRHQEGLVVVAAGGA